MRMEPELKGIVSTGWLAIGTASRGTAELHNLQRSLVIISFVPQRGTVDLCTSKCYEVRRTLEGPHRSDQRIQSAFARQNERGDARDRMDTTSLEIQASDCFGTLLCADGPSAWNLPSTGLGTARIRTVSCPRHEQPKWKRDVRRPSTLEYT